MNDLKVIKIKNYYEVLKIDKNVSKDDIQKEYIKFFRKYHPDLDKYRISKKYFKLLTKAYETLYDDEKRSKYDSINHNNLDDYNDNYYDSTWIIEYIRYKNKIKDFNKLLKSLSQYEMLITYDFYWRTYWIGSTSWRFITRKKLSVSILNIFDENLHKSTYLSYMNQSNFRQLNELYIKKVNEMLLNLKKDKVHTWKKFNYMADIINEDNIFDIPYVSILGLINKSITIELFKEIENIWEIAKDIPYKYRESKKGKIFHKESNSKFLLVCSTVIGIILFMILIIFLLITWK